MYSSCENVLKSAETKTADPECTKKCADEKSDYKGSYGLQYKEQCPIIPRVHPRMTSGCSSVKDNMATCNSHFPLISSVLETICAIVILVTSMSGLILTLCGLSKLQNLQWQYGEDSTLGLVPCLVAAFLSCIDGSLGISVALFPGRKCLQALHFLQSVISFFLASTATAMGAYWCNALGDVLTKLAPKSFSDDAELSLAQSCFALSCTATVGCAILVPAQLTRIIRICWHYCCQSKDISRF